MIRREGGPATTNVEGEYRILLTAKPDATYARRFRAKADEKAESESLHIKVDGQSLTFETSGDLLEDTRVIDRILKSMDLPGAHA
jgi:hypothetical protein